MNSFTNENKHLRLFDLMGGMAKVGKLGNNEAEEPNQYFNSFLKNKNSNPAGNQDERSEADKFLAEYQEIVEDMEYNGMSLSLNERITVLNSKTAQLIGLYNTLKKKREE